MVEERRVVELYQLQHEFAEYRVKSIRPVPAYFWYRGRNAWNRVWSMRSVRHALQDRRETAECEAEAARHPGNVFYIEEVPCLAFHSASACLLCTQLGREAPFRDF